MRPSKMMPTYFSLQGLGQVTSCPSHGRFEGHTHQRSLTNAVAPSKRSAGEDDDEIQFISENPVKRRRTSRKQPVTPISVQSVQPAVPFTAAAPAAPTNIYTASTIVPSLAPAVMEMASGDLKDTERRLSTGMVGLPSDIHAMELTYSLRGVSMPVLERFVLDQPFRRPRQPSPPELSPKQLPSAISPAKPSVQNQDSQYAPGAFDCAKPSSPLTIFPTPNHTPGQVKKPAIPSHSTKTALDIDQTQPSEPVRPNGHASLLHSDRGRRIGSRSTPMPPSLPTLPYSEAHHDEPSSRGSPRPSANHHDHNSPAPLQKPPCHICSRLRHQAQYSRAQGLPMVKAALPPHMMPPLHYHSPYGQHLHPQMMTVPTSNMHQVGSNFSSVMMPINGSPFVSLPSHPQPQPSPQQVTSLQQKEAERDKQPTAKQFKEMEVPQTTQPKSTTAAPKATPSSIKPPASLIQPTYRKPSPNLIVDVAETCQEKFPFEEVAKRHNVPVDKVFDIFAAIIQVPLLRCPTDRRRQGKLATARIKEYNKAKENIHQQKPEGDGTEAVANPVGIAQRLGQVDFPKGFTLGGTS
ncbi:hypothetical protein F5X97DRAFT_164025 [Nemania serpens]|nr:hypothetical protein F5X97DRAFT_164025 [Nemania serpens]